VGLTVDGTHGVDLLGVSRWGIKNADAELKSMGGEVLGMRERVIGYQWCEKVGENER
jgi:hypothetical protein